VRVAPWLWALFGALVLGMLALDLGLDRRRRRGARDGRAGSPRTFTLRTAAAWSGAWIALGLGFGLLVLALHGPTPALTYLTAYLLEKSLSVDNLFVFVLIFGELSIPAAEQRRVLSWGILGALAMRALLIAAGVLLLERFRWVIYPFAALILLAAARLLWGERKERESVARACAVCGGWVARLVPVTPVLHGGRFVVRQGARLVVTPLLVALVVVETTDAIFALDSIPAVLAVTREPFLVYTSNVFAVAGLRSLYFLLAGAVARFHALRYALAAILAFVGVKMLLGGVVDVPPWVSLAAIVGIVAAAVAAAALARTPISETPLSVDGRGSYGEVARSRRVEQETGDPARRGPAGGEAT
jgi:tellurite resistance protein TerC